MDRLDFFAYHHERLTQVEWLKSQAGQAAVKAYLDARKAWAIQYDEEQQKTKVLNEKLETIFRDTTIHQRVRNRFKYKREKLFQLPKRTTFAHKEEQCRTALGVMPETLEQYVWRCHEIFPDNTTSGACELILNPYDEPEAYALYGSQRKAFYQEQLGYRRLAANVAKRFQQEMKRMFIPVEIEYGQFFIAFAYGCEGGTTAHEREWFLRHLGAAAHAAGAWLGTSHTSQEVVHATFGIRLTEGAFEKRYLKC